MVDIYVRENSILTADEYLRESWAEEIWDESQSFWYEISEAIKPNIDFVGKLIESAKKEIDSLFPLCDKVFGEKATQLLVDLAFQSNLYDYTKISKPDLVDMRRMVNIAGQIVEEILSHTIFDKELTIGELYRLLDSFNKELGPEKVAFFKKFPAGSILLTKPFLSNLKIVKQARDPSSHGASADDTIADAFYESLRALIEKHTGVLPTLYKLLSEGGNS